METEYPELIKNVSSCKSPMSMQSALLKNFWANTKGIDPSTIFSVAIMPCVAKKFESERTELINKGLQNTDAVLTTRELVRKLRASGINLAKMPKGEYDDPMGEGTGAGKIFGATGGVMEAAIRTGYWMITNENLSEVEIKNLRGMKGIKEISLDINDKINLKCVAAHGLKNIRKICEELVNGNPNDYNFIEFMACPGGCINGGGQPRDIIIDTIKKRADALYRLDKDVLKKRLSHENVSVQQVYSSYLRQVGGKKAHNLLHTKYYPRYEEGL